MSVVEEPVVHESAAPPLDEVLRASYRLHASREAIRDERGRLTYGELGQRVRRLANGLRAAGLRPGDRLMLIAGNRSEWVVADHACYAGSFARVAALPRLHPRELAQIAQDAEPSAVIADGAWLAGTDTGWIPAEVRIRIAIGDEVPPGWQPFEDVIAGATDEELEPDDPDGVRWILYTSGTTGVPKGVILTNRTLGAMVANMLTELPPLDHRTVALHSAPISHFSGGMAAAVFATGGRNVLMSSFDLPALLSAIERGEANLLPLVPTQIVMLLEALDQEERNGIRRDTSAIQTVMYAGSAIAPDRLAAARRRLGPVMLQFYGSSEAPFPLTALQPLDHTDEVAPGAVHPRMASAGRPNRFTEVRVMDDDLNVLGPGQVGEVVARGAQITPGYWRNPEATREVLSPDGWCRTGDVGYFDEAGFLYLVDRKKEMIISGGFNVYPREIENVISTLPGVREVAVVGAPSEKWGEQVTAFISVTDGSSVTEAEVIAHCRAHLGGYKVPKEVRFRPDLPKSGAGKISKRELRDELWAGRTRRL
jgi:acyl-CoA synthetase (AMP-forming)/AMP-acid ligase II